jgi:Notch-like protein
MQKKTVLTSSNYLFTLKVDSCQSSPCGTNLCISSEDGFQCTCNAGFTGIRCDTPIDFCDENSCEHGQCSNKATGYECLCDEGYSGHLCDVIEGLINVLYRCHYENIENL